MTTPRTAATGYLAVGFEPDDTDTSMAVGFDDPQSQATETGWTMLAVYEGKDTRDSQMVRLFRPGSIRFPEQDMALLWQAAGTHGGEDPGPAVRVGTVTGYARDGDAIMLTGRYVDTFEAQDFARLVAAGDAGWPSIRVSDDDVIVSEEPAPDLGEGVDVMPDQRVEWVDGLLIDVCVVTTPGQEGTWIRPAGAEPVVASGPLVSAGPLRPPAEWFAEPDETVEPWPWTVHDDGQVSGYIGLRGVCHSTFRNACVQIPEGVDYTPFHRGGEVVCADGSRVAIGHITVGTSHADLSLRGRDRDRHYDHTGWSGALVRAGENRHGTWIAGSVRADADDLQVYALRASATSGDWDTKSPWEIDLRRKWGSDQMELCAILLVNVPGYGQDRPVRSEARVASGVLEVLVASGAARADFDRPPVDGKASAVLRVLGPAALASLAAQVDDRPARLAALTREVG